MDWDKEQLSVINDEKSSRQIVEAGPGTGKTAVACARVASLIDVHEVPPSKIWLLSFTRTAVREIRNRIEDYVDDPKDALSVKITTLDSQVWYLRQGFDEQDVKKLLNSYDANIERIIELLDEQDDNLLDYLEELEHVIIDEAQDLVGVRSKLILSLVSNLHPDCGITVFADSAQAIYGFTSENGYQTRDSVTSLVDILMSGDYGEFRCNPIKTIHRTENSQLLDIFTGVRELALSEDYSAEEKVEKIKEEIIGKVGSDLPKAEHQELEGRNDVLLLYRTRAEVLQASSFLWSSNVPHKLRMSGLPVRLQPWIARLFYDFTDRYITKDVFLSRWQERVNNHRDYAHNINADSSWADLLQYADKGNTTVDMRLVRRTLSRSRPPIEFIVDEVMLPGPMLGTIHASKGREADAVHLMLRKDIQLGKEPTESQIDEEGRVVFVGATRAIKELKVGNSSRTYASRLNNEGRVYKLGKKTKSPRAQTEFLRESDIDKYMHVRSDQWDDNESMAHSVQDFLWENCISHVPLYAENSADTNYRYWLHTLDGSMEWVGCLSEWLNNDLWDLAKIVEKHYKKKPLRPGSKIRSPEHGWLQNGSTA